MILVWAIVVTSCFFTLINRGQPLYAVSTGTSQGNLGGGAVNLPNLKAGEPLVATAGGGARRPRVERRPVERGQALARRNQV